MSNDNSWNKLSSVFAGNRELDTIPVEAADNILIAWPVILGCISENISAASKLRALDYGCGGGRFANELTKYGFETYGIDTANELVKSANSQYGKLVNFEVGDELTAALHGPFDVIASIMTFEFIQDVEKTLTVLSESLNPGGMFIFATHNLEYVAESMSHENNPYGQFDVVNLPTSGNLRFGDINIPMHLRSSEQYKNLMTKMGFKLLLEAYPPFTEEFLQSYPTEGPTDTSEFLILGFRKDS